MIKVKMPFEHVQLNCTEPCKVRKGTPRLANYGLIQNSVLTKGARRISARELELAIERSAVIPEEYRQHGHD